MKHKHRFGIAAVCIVLGGWCALGALAGDNPKDPSPGHDGRGAARRGQ